MWISRRTVGEFGLAVLGAKRGGRRFPRLLWVWGGSESPVVTMDHQAFVWKELMAEMTIHNLGESLHWVGKSLDCGSQTSSIHWAVEVYSC